MPGADWQVFASPDRAGWLAADLAAAGLAPLPPGPPLALRGDAEVAGLLYVIEGSALGATRLAPDAQALGWHAGHGASFLHRHGGLGAGLRWRGFLQLLETAPFDAAGQQSMLAAAARAFACADHEFERATLAAAACALTP